MAASTATAYVHPGAQVQEIREYPKKIVIRSQNRIFLQTVSEIEHLTAAANYVQIHAAGQTFRIRSTINGIEQRLDPRKFGRIHRCTIVNFDCVKEFRPLQRGDYLLILNDGGQLKMSRRHRDQLEKLTCASASHLVKYGSAGNENTGLAPTNSVGGRGPAFV